MRKFLIAASLSLAAAFCAGAEVTLTSAIKSMPSMILPPLDASTRAELLAYPHTDGVQIEDGVFANIVMPSEQQAIITVGESRTAELFLLPDVDLIMLLDNFNVPVKDTALTIFNSKWEPQPIANYIDYPGISDWMKKDVDASKREDIKSRLPYLCIEITYNPAAKTLTMRPSLGNYIATEDASEVSGALVDAITYKWNGKKFKKI